MYFCECCESVFQEKEDLGHYHEHGEFWGSPYSETHYICPNCKEDVIYIDKANYHTCEHCGELCTYQYIKTADGNYYCGACYDVKNIND